MAYGTARITKRNGLYVVTWRNHGNDLANEPRGFHSAIDAERFCHEHSLRIVA